MRSLINCAMLGVLVVAGCALAAPAAAQPPAQSDVFIPEQPPRFEHGWFWDPTDEAWKYGWYQPGNIEPRKITREFVLAGNETRAAIAPASLPPLPTELRGIILDIEQRRISSLAPPEVFVIVRTDDGTLRTLDLGAAQFVFQTVPDLQQNQQVLLRGNLENVAGRDFFNPVQVVTSQSTLLLPTFATSGRVRGTLVNLYTVPGHGDFEKILVAQIHTLEGRVVDVVLGPTDQVGNQFYSLHPGTPFVAEGFVQETPSGTRVYAQSVRVQERLPAEAVAAPPATGLVYSTEKPAVSFTPAPVSALDTIQGQIVGLRPMWIGGQSHLIAEVVTDAGNLVRADLGLSSAVDYLNLSTGEMITVTGQPVIISGQNAIVANQFAVRGQSIFVESIPPVNAVEMPQAVGAVETTTGPVQMFHGRVLAKRTESVPGYTDRRLVVDLLLDDGQVLPVDLGLKRFLRGLDIDVNNCITVWGNNGLVDGQPGLIAVTLQDRGLQLQVGRCE